MTEEAEFLYTPAIVLDDATIFLYTYIFIHLFEAI